MTPRRLSGSGRTTVLQAARRRRRRHYRLIICRGDGYLPRDKVAWTDESTHPVEEHSAYITLGQRLPAQLTNYPKRADGRDAWTDGFQPDGLVYISGEWHQATVSTQTVTSNIQFRTAVQGAHKTAGRIYSLRDWAPIWEFGKPEMLKTSVGGNIKIPSYVFRGFVDATGEVGAAVGDASGT